MTGVDCLLDTCAIIGLLDNQPEALALLIESGAATGRAHYSSITRMELLGWPSVTDKQATAIKGLLADMRAIGINEATENQAIHLRRTTSLKLPDAIIGATAQVHGLRLITLDAHLLRQLERSSAA